MEETPGGKGEMSDPEIQMYEIGDKDAWVKWDRPRNNDGTRSGPRIWIEGYLGDVVMLWAPSQVDEMIEALQDLRAFME
jgi:hypothetical protein